MSATPIPRTLNMALSGIKEISTLMAPPRNRKSITTLISWYNETQIIKIINYESARAGQVFFVQKIEF